MRTLRLLSPRLPIALVLGLLVVPGLTGLPPASAAGGWVPPLTGPLVVLRPFQPSPNPYAAGHRGVDLAAPVGTEVRAAGAGRVTFAAVLAGRGVVTVTHGALRTTYEPVEAVVHTGDAVSAGAQIGWLTAPTGHCRLFRSCLHWGLLRGRVYLDPMGLLGPLHVRLLPLRGAAEAGAAAKKLTAVPLSAPPASPAVVGARVGGPAAGADRLVADTSASRGVSASPPPPPTARPPRRAGGSPEASGPRPGSQSRLAAASVLSLAGGGAGFVLARAWRRRVRPHPRR